QGIKRGIMELCDALFITKADGENLEKAKLAVAEYENAMHLLAPKQNNWIPVVSQCSALTGEGIDKAWEVVQEYITHTQANHTFEARRMQQEHYWMETVFHKMVSDKLSTDTTLTKLRKKLLS